MQDPKQHAADASTMAPPSTMRALLCILLLVPYGSSAFTTPSSRTSPLFGGKQSAWRQTVSSSRPRAPWQQPPSFNHASKSIINKSSGNVALNALREPREDGRKRNAIARFKRWMASCRKVTTTFLVAAFIAFSCFLQSASAVSGGRMGGSFSPSSSRSSGGGGGSPSMHRSSGYNRGYSGSSRGHTTRIYAPSYRMGPSYYPTRLFHSSTDAPVRRFGVADAVVLGGTGVVLYSIISEKRKDSRTALGEGVSVASITLSLNVPDRDDFYSILNKLKRLAESADTSTRQGVQTLVSNVAMELLRDESSITSAKTTSLHFTIPRQAEREFQRISVQERSKFDKESVNKYSGQDIGQVDAEVDKAIRDKATEAVVTISIAIEGDQTELPEIRSREDCLYALTRIAADAPVEDCLVSGEVLWAPELRSEQLTRQDIFADHPNLYPL